MRALSDLDRPFICCSVAEKGVDEAIRTIRLAALEGAHAFEVHLPMLGYPDRAELARLFESTTRPVYATCRRASFYGLLGLDESALDPIRRTDEERVDELLAAVNAGAAGVDVELDTFDPTPAPEGPTATLARSDDEGIEPAEFTRDDRAVVRQQETVEAVHDQGAEVVLSCHPMVHISPEAAVDIGRTMEARGADLAKIVGVDRSLYDALDTFKANLRMDEAVDVPFNMMSMGDATRAARLAYPFFGSSWVFCQLTQTPGGFEAWPLVENAREVFRRTDWEPAWAAHRDRTTE